MPPEEQRAQQYKKIAKKPASGTRGPVAGKKNKSGDTYFRTCSTIIGSESLTAVFEMGTGGSFQICSPENGPAGF